MKLSIYKKMMIGYAVVICVMILVNAYVLFELNAVSQAARTTLTSNVQAIDLAKQLQSILFEEERNGQKYMILQDNTYFALFAEDTARFAESVGSLRSMPLASKELRLLDAIASRHASAVQTIIHEKENKPRSDTAVSAGTEKAWADSIDAIHGTLAEFIRLNQLSIARAMNNVESTTHRSLNIAMILTVCTVVLAIAAAFIITRTITRPIQTLIRGSQQIARGKFDPIHVTSKDEVALLARAINDMSAQLNKINELKEELMQHIAHELRTPLATMLTAHYLLAEQPVGPLTAEQRRLLTSIRNGIDKLTTFSHNFLDLSKIEAGMMEYRFERTDPGPIIKALVADAALVASQKNITVSYADASVSDVMIDKEKFAQALTNLLSNAIKYTQSGGAITVTLSPCDAGVRLGVRDTGVGIASEDLPKIFTKFYRVTRRSATTVKGTGVGLALVKAITEGHGGKVYATSTLGVGSTFTIELPAAPESENSTRMVAQQPSTAGVS